MRCEQKGKMMKTATRTSAGLAGTGAALFLAMPAWAQELAAPAAAAPFTPTAAMVDKGDTTWMLISSALVLLMSIPALALFYGGLVRAKNMLSVLMQVLTIVAIAALVWVGWGSPPRRWTPCWRRLPLQRPTRATPPGC